MAKPEGQVVLSAENILKFFINVVFIAIGIFYISTVADIITDAIPLWGYMDDAAVVLLLLGAMANFKKRRLLKR